MAKLFPVYKFARGHWGQRETIFYASSDQRAIDFACEWRRANPWSQGCYLAISLDNPDPSLKADTYRGWHLDFEYGYHTATHDNYDASWEGEEDGWVDNGLRLSERTLADLITEIDLHDASAPTSWDTRVPAADIEELTHG
jgi:hypothetical protein